MPTEFDFELSNRLKEKFPNKIHNYHAEQIDKDIYKITWIDDNNLIPSSYLNTKHYTTKEVEDNVYNNHWIIKE